MKQENSILNSESEIQEIEQTDESATTGTDDIISPFDPKEIKIIIEPKTVGGLISRMENNEIDLNTEFQRKGNLWKPDVQSRLIESILLRFPLPAFYFDATDEDKWLVVDGLQRLWTLKNFAIDKTLELNGLEILLQEEYRNVTFDKLNRTMQRRILETQVTTYLIQPGTPKRVKYNVFRRINTGGLGLTPQEIRNALNQGRPTDYLKQISENKLFKKYIKVSDKRMADKELILRYIAYTIFDYKDYQKPLTDFLDKAMEKISDLSKERLLFIEEGLYKSLELTHKLFGRKAFSRAIIGKGINMLNSALFETWTSQLAKLNQTEIDKLLENRIHLIEGFKNLLLKDEIFSKSISTSTGGKSEVRTRFERIESLINWYIKEI